MLPQRTRNTGNCGAWSYVASPNPDTSYDTLNGVAAISANNVWAVGSYGSGSLTFIEQWNGAQWKVVASPDVNGNNSLSGIAAISANNIWAVGSYNNASTLIEHWNGTNWSVVASPNVPSLADGLTAISAVSATDIWAVGTVSGNKGFQGLIEHWNGTSWSIVSSQGVGQLTGVAAIASNNVWAVGSASGTKNIQTLIEHWNGTSWSVVKSSGPGLAANTLNGVAAISANNVWAVGDDTNSVGPHAEFAPLIEHWNGASWSVVSSPLQGTSDLVNGIAAISATNIWAVGDYRTGLDPYGPYYTWIEHWNGASWSAFNSPSPGSIASDLLAAAPVPATSKAWSVGFTQGDNNYQTLTESYC
ncbi:MAG: hypothetical protein NVS3B14_21010 [Ktedonobacteraceae bacterium]